MPFASEAQRRFLYSQHPDVAKEFEDKTDKNKKLPDRIAKKRALRGLANGKNRKQSSH